MNAKLDPTLLPALAAIFDREMQPRRYAPEPFVDYHAEIFRRQCERDVQLREVMAEREEQVKRERDPRSDEQFFYDEQCPSDASFR